MSTEWTLALDLRQNGHDLIFTMNLFDRDRTQRRWQNKPLKQSIFQQIVGAADRIFGSQRTSSNHRAHLQSFQNMAEGEFQMSRFLTDAGFADSDTLAINTIVTSIPWDLVRLREQALGLMVDVGLSIPRPHGVAFTGRGGDGPPRFLHVISNPSGDLRHAGREADALRQMIDPLPGVEYEPLVDPNLNELIEKLAAGSGVRFLHFTGHVVPGRGLVLRDDEILEAETIAGHFRGQRDQLVFLNGCDAAYQRPAGEAMDMFQTSSFANAFLAAGASTVIAPRSFIGDAEASLAAEQIWRRLLEGEKAARAVRQFRVSSVEAGGSGGYSYVLYGDPSARAGLVGRTGMAASSVHASAPDIVLHPLVLDAAAQTSGPVRPRHLFAALTFRWLVGQAYFDTEGQTYIHDLEEMRSRLDLEPRPRPGPGAPSPELSPAARLVVSRAMENSADGGLDELALLESLAGVDDPEIQCVLDEPQRVGPRSLRDLVTSVRTWMRDGRRAPPAVFLPWGMAEPSRFLEAERYCASGSPTGDEIEPWDLFLALAAKTKNVSVLVRDQGVNLPVPRAWRAGQPLYWQRMTIESRSVVLGALQMAEAEQDTVVREGNLAYNLFREAMSWPELSALVRQDLENCKVSEAIWMALVARIQLLSLRW